MHTLLFQLLPFLILLFTNFPSTTSITIQDPLPSCKGFKIYNSLDSSSGLGRIISSGADINGDKIPDIILANDKYPALSTIYVIYGGKTSYSNGIDLGTMTSTQGFRISGVLLLIGDNMDFLSSAGDVDGDGIADIVIGAAGVSSQAGAVYVIYGKKGGYTDFDVSSLTPSQGFKITDFGGTFGCSVDTRADFNGDGIADIMIGASKWGPGANTGAGYVIYGQKAREADMMVPSSGPTTRGFIIAGYSGGYVGVSITSAGDFNGDKIDDLVISAIGDSTNKGKAYVVYGQKGGYTDFTLNGISAGKGFVITRASPFSKLGRVVSFGRDFNNDKISDIVIASVDSNVVFIIYGKVGDPTDLSISSIPAGRGFLIHGVTPSDAFGSSLASTEDINGDGITDIIIGAYSANAVYVIYGTEKQPSPNIELSTLTSKQGVKILGSASGSLLGVAVRDLGDINQDGVPDIIVASQQQQTFYVLFGQNAWACDTCNGATCKKCNPGYDYTYNGVCFIECPVYAPYKVGFTCLAEDPNPIPAGTKATVTKGAAATGAANNVLNLCSPADALPFIYGQLKTSIIYMRYMNISRTNKLEELFNLYYDSDPNVIPFVSMSNTIKDAFPQESLPYMFRKYSLPSSLLEQQCIYF